jgi:Ca-activated chloride channel family protein
MSLPSLPAYLQRPRVQSSCVSFSQLLSVPLSILLFSGFSLVSLSQNGPPAQEVEVVRVRTDLITVPVQVLDAKSKSKSGFSEKDFSLLVDGVPTKIDYFSNGVERLALMFLLDQSGSVRDIISRQHTAALDIFRHFSTRAEVAVVRFDEQAYLTAPFSYDGTNAEAAFAFSAAPNHHTAIFDSVEASLGFFDKRRRDPVERRILVVISDGLDTGSRTSWTQVVAHAQESGATICAIQIGLFTPVDGDLKMRRATKGFREMAERTGGSLLLIGDRTSALVPSVNLNLAGLFAEIERDLQNQVIMGFYPPDSLRDGAKHRITVKLIGDSSKKLRIKAGRQEFILRSNPAG